MTEPLDEIAKKAEFKHVDGKNANSGGSSIRYWVEGPENLFYSWGDILTRGIWPNLSLLTFDDPMVYSGAKLYQLTGDELYEATSKARKIKLAELTPERTGKEVVSFLKPGIE